MAYLPCLFLIASVAAQDGLDVVQVSVVRPNASKDESEDESTQKHSNQKMQCDDNTEGFVDNGKDITGLLKSCPIDAPYVDGSKVCEDGFQLKWRNKAGNPTCQVEDDRKLCCSTTPTCKCENGEPVEGADCTTNGAQQCKTCKKGYYDVDEGGTKVCKPNKCTCPGGEPTTANGKGNKKCEKHLEVDCSKCKEGYKMSEEAGPGSQTCKPITCKCNNGVGAGNGDPKNNPNFRICKKQDADDCQSCHDGYELDPPGSSNGVTRKCTKKTCSTSNLPTDPQYDTTECTEVTYNGTCSVECASDKGYTGKSEDWKCDENGILSGNNPSCTKNTCSDSEHKHSECFGKHADTKNCGKVQAMDTCHVTCSEGYEGTAQTVTCTAAGKWKCDAATECTEKSCGLIEKPENGDYGTCKPDDGTEKIASGQECKIKCDDGYEPQGSTTCKKGKYTEIATCEKPTCDATALGDNYENKGTCTDSLASGQSCKPLCLKGFKLSGSSTCNEGKLQAATCEPDIDCELEYPATLGDKDFGFWTAEAADLTYAGCEAFCARKSAEELVTGCELFKVGSDVRATAGLTCFAHLEKWSTLQVTKANKTLQVTKADKIIDAACKVAKDPVKSKRDSDAKDKKQASDDDADDPTPRPTPRPTLRPTDDPTPRPTPRPTLRPTPRPTLRPTPRPTPRLTMQNGGGYLVCSMDGEKQQGAYTFEEDTKCNGWHSNNFDHCQNACLNNLVAPNCKKQSEGKKCIATVFWEATQWCHLYDKCTFSVTTKDKTVLTKASHPMQNVGNQICSSDGENKLTPYTQQEKGRKEGCDGWDDKAQISAEQCQSYCRANAIPVDRNCKVTVPKGKICVAALYYTTGWCHLFDQCSKTIPFDGGVLYKVPYPPAEAGIPESSMAHHSKAYRNRQNQHVHTYNHGQ